MRRLLWVWALLLLAGCGAAQSSDDVLHVYAASSLTEAFGELKATFEARYPGTDVKLTLAGSQILRLQIEQGAPADVFASADPDHMQALWDEGLAGDVRAFASNALVVIVPLGDPAAIDSFEQLPRARRVVLGTKNVPAGRYAREVLRRAGEQAGDNSDFEARVLNRVVSEENNVRLVRAKVELGEADGAFVYQTDALASNRVRIVPIPEALNPRASYVIGIVGDAAERRSTEALGLANDWIAQVLSEEGRAVLRRHGFGLP